VSQLNVNTISPQSGSSIKITGTISGSNMNLSGDVTAQRFVVSSSITKLVTITNSGSTAFGDSLDDTHIYTGSLQLTGSLTASKFSGDGSGITNVAYSNVVSRPTLISGSAQISSAISGSFTSVSSSLASRLTTAESELTNTLISSSAQIASDISGSFNKGFEFEGNISGSSTSTGSFGRVEASTYAGVESFSDGTATLISGSATSTGSFGSVETAGNITIPSTNKIFLDDGGDTYIQESSGNVVDFYVGGDNALKIGAQSVEIPRYFAHMGDTNNYIDFGTDTQTFVTDGGNTLELLSNHDVVASQGDIIATSGNISGSATSTGSFGSVETAGNITIPGTNKIFLDGGGDTYIQESSGNVVDFYVGGDNALKIGAQSVEIPRYFAHMGDTNNYIDFTTDTQTFVTDGGNTLELLSNHNVVASQGDIIATSGNISGSITSTGSFGRVEATTIGGNSPLTIESDNFNVRADGTISGSANSTASFGKAKFDRTVAIGDQALNAIGNYTLWVEDHDNGNGIYAADQSFFSNAKIYNDFFLSQEHLYATLKVSANNRGLLLDPSYGGGYTGDIFHRATGHRFFPRGSVTKGQELFVITGSHFQSSSVMLSGSAASTASFGRVEATAFAGDGAALTNVPDYVYEPTYELRTINDLEDFVTEKKHLPNVPDMNDMDKWKSLSVGDRDMLLLEKIEELSLYIIELNKRIEKLENN